MADTFDVEPGAKVAGALQVGNDVGLIANEALSDNDVLVYDTADGKWHPAPNSAGSVTSVSVTAPIVNTGTSTAPVIGISAASGVAAGSMSSADFTKLAGIAASATNTPLSVATPQPIGTASAGSGTSASKDDHVHALPAVLASPAGSNLTLNANQAGGSVILQSNGVAVLTAGSSSTQLGSTTFLPAGDQTSNIGTSGTRFANVFAPTVNAGATFLTYTSNVTDGASAIAHKIFNTTTLANATAKIVQFGSNAVEKAAILASGAVVAPSIGTSSSALHVLPSGTEEILAPARGTAGQVLTSTGAGSAPAMAAPITATTGSAVLGSTFLITGASGVYQDTGLTLSLPSAGTYMLRGRILGNVNVLTSGPGFISCKFRDVTAGADVANSQTVIAFVQAINSTVIVTAPMLSILTVSGATSVNLYAARNLAGTYNTSELNSTSSGYTEISYIKIGP